LVETCPVPRVPAPPRLRENRSKPLNLLSQSSTGAGARKSNRRFWPEGRASGNERVKATTNTEKSESLVTSYSLQATRYPLPLRTTTSPVSPKVVKTSEAEKNDE
jgi:hypothetical protein